MKNTLTFRLYTILLFLLLLAQPHTVFAQCTNVGFENGDFTGWTGINKGATAGFDQGTNDAAPNTANSHFIMTGGFDAALGGTLLPQVCPLIPGNTRSMRLGNQTGGSSEESITYTFTVDQNNSNFTYYYAVVLDNSAPHTGDEQPYFKITMTDANNAELTCAKYDINATTGKGIPGFTITPTSGSAPAPAPIPGFTLAPVGVGGGGANWKNWSAVTIPLATYMGQTVKIKFETRDCRPGISAGSHWAYAYVDASCSPLEIIKSSESVCPGQTVKLVAPSAQAYSWKGPSPGSIVSGATTATVTVNTEGTYTVTLTAFGDAACTYTLTANMAPFKPGDGVAVNSATICFGESVTLTASGGAPYTWAPGGQTTPSITVNPTSTTTYSVTGGSCVSTNTGIVTVNQIPTSPFTVTSVCANAGSTITYTGNAPGTATYTWDFTGSGGTIISGSGQGPYSVSWPTSGSKAITLKVDNGPCPSPVTTNSVTINPAPILTITPSTICTGLTGTLAAAGADTYVWSDNSTAATLTSPAINANTTYTVTGTALGCSSTASGTITVNQLQNASFSYPSGTVCKSGGGGNPTPTISGVTGGTFSSAPAGLSIDGNSGVVNLGASALGNYTINYNTPGPCPNSSTFLLSIVDVPVADFSYGTYCKNVANPLPTFQNSGSAGTFSSTGGLTFVSASTGEINLAASLAGNYTVTNSINSAGCPPTSATNTITINAIPNVTVDNPTACSGDPAIITAAGATNYTWSDNSTANTLSVTPTITTPYTVVGESNGCRATAISTVNVNAKPTVTVQSKTICEGTTTAIYPSGTATSYAWSNGTSLDSMVVAAPTANIAFSVVGTANGCSSSAIGNVTVNGLPTVTVNNDAICQGGSSVLTASGASTYIWIGPGGVFSLGNPNNVAPTTSPSTYTVIGTTANCSGLSVTTPAEQQVFRTCFISGCSDTEYATVTINPVPTSNFTVTSQCIGQAATITYTGNAPGNATYNWNFNGGVAVPGTGQGPHTVIWPAAGTQNVSLSISLGTCSSTTTTVPVIVKPLPVFTVTSPTICVGDIARPAASNNALTYKWADGTTAISTSASPTAETTYSVTGTANGCNSVQTYKIYVNPVPTITSSDATICKGEAATLTASGASNYIWSNNTIGNVLTVTPSEDPTEFIVTGTDAIGCQGTAVGRITVISIPKAEFNFSPDPAFVTYPTITFTDKSSSTVTSWKWNFGDGDSLLDVSPNPIHTYPTEDSTYIVTLTVTAGLCEAKKTREVVIGPEFSFYMPNAFSPNGDDDNDVFFGKGKGIIEYKLMIFDRWGNFIFLSEDINKGWDGSVNGSIDIAQQDTYVWKVELMDVFKKKRSFIGTVAIVIGK